MSARRPIARGDVVLATFPFTDLPAAKRRPAVIVGRVRGDDVILAFISSRTVTHDPSAEYLLDTSDPEFPATGLKVTSLVRLDRLATLHRRLLARRLGRVGPHTEHGIAQGLRYVLQL